MSPNESYTTEEIARHLKVSKLTVYDLIKKGDLRAYRVGRQIRIDAKELENYKLRGQEVQFVSSTVKNTNSPRSIVISGQDSSLDILARELEQKTNDLRPLRSYSGSLDSLVNMYQGHSDIVSTHLLDGDTLEYNIPYVRKLLVSKSFLVVKFIARQAGIYVAKGNPKGISAWQDLKKTSITITNREPGAGARVLLDEQLRIHNIKSTEVKGYEKELTSHMAVASAVAKGRVDAGVGIAQTSKMAEVDFIPLITESYDLVMLKKEENIDLITYVLDILRNDQFKDELQSLGYIISGIGEIIWEQ